MNVHFKSFDDAEIIDRVPNCKGNVISKKVDMRDNSGSDEFPRRLVIIESNIVSAKPNDIKAKDNRGFQNQLTLRRPINIDSV